MNSLKAKYRRRLQAGNAIVMLFAAIGMAGVVTYGLNNVIRGPAVTTAEVSRRTIAENNLVATTRLAISSATHQQGSDGDCDGDGFVEPLPYRDAGAGPHPAGGGYIPSTMGASMSDPWGNQYGYCVWDPGTVSVSDAMPACGGATPRRLQGAPRDDQYAIAVVSAGKNGVFETQCRDYIDANADNVPDNLMLETDAGSDDIVLAYSYAEANGIGGGEWRVKDGTPGTAEIGKNIALGSTSNPRGAAFNDGLELGGTRGLILPRDPGDNTVTGACDAGKENQLRLNIGDGSEVPLLEVCYSNAWTVVSGGTNIGGTPTTSCTIGPWTSTTIGTSWGHYHDVIYAGGQWVAVSAHSNIVATSPDGITWTERSTPDGEWYDLAYGNGVYVVTGSGGTNRLISSTDGITWTARTPVGYTLWAAVAFGNGIFVAVSQDGTDRVMTSTDGVTWTARTPSQTAGWSSVIFDGTQFVASAGSGAGTRLMTSPDGINWTNVTNDAGGFGRIASDGNGTYAFAGGGSLASSANTGLATWTWTAMPAGMGNGSAMAYGGGNFVGVGFSGPPYIVSSQDAVTWTPLTTPSAIWVGIGYGNDKFIVTGYNGDAMYAECVGGVGGEEAAPPVMPHPLDSGLIAHWKLDEGTGTAVTDSAGDNNGLFVNTPQWASRGPVGSSSLTFQHDDQDAVSINGLLGEPENGTIALWANVAYVESNSAEFLSLGDNVALREHIDRGITLIVHNGGGVWDGVPTDVKIRGTGWHHVVGTWDQTEDMYRVYIDGTLVSQSVIAAPIDWGRGANTFIGRHGNVEPNYNMDGALDDIRVYNRALSPLEVQQLYERSQGGSEITLRAAATTTTPLYGQLSISYGGQHGCAIKKDGSLWCWGNNSGGVLGNGDRLNAIQHSPIRVSQQSIHNFTQVSAGRNHTCGVTADGSGWCWGNDAQQELGNGASTATTYIPGLVSGGHLWSLISASDYYSCGLRTDGTVYCWGSDATGQLGNGASGNQNAPFAITGSALYSYIDTAEGHACGIQTNGSAWCWGAGADGRLGNGAIGNQQSPVAVSGNMTWKDISVQGARSCGVTTNGSLYCWGQDYTTTPTPLFPSDTWTAVDVGFSHTCAIKPDGSLWCWGTDNFGQLGNSMYSSTTQNYPNRVLLPGPVVAVATRSFATCAMEASGALWCWGNESNGSLGNGSTLTLPQIIPTQVFGWPDVAPFVWASSATSFQINGGMTIALGNDKWVSDDGSARYFGFESAGKARLRQTGSSNQLLVETQAALSDAQISFRREASAAADYTTGRVAEWLFNDAAGSSTAAAAVGGLSATISGTGVFNTTGGRLSTNGVLEFDGTGRASVANNAILRPTTFTVSFWMRPNNQQEPGATVLSKAHTNNTGTQEQTYGFEFDAMGNLLFATGITGAQDFLSSEVPVRINSWVHVVGVYDPAGSAPQKRLYINGVLSGSKVLTTPLVYDATAAGNLFFGAAGCLGICQPFSGAIDDVRIYNTALTTAQVAGLFQSQSSSVALPRAVGINHANNNLEIARQTAAGTEMVNSLTADLTLTSTGSLGLGSTSPTASVDVNGGVRVGYEASCTSASQGAIRYTANITDVGRPLTCSGTSWVNGAASGGLVFNSLAYGQGKFIAPDTSASGNYYTSANGINWLLTSGMPLIGWQGIAYGNNMWVAVGLSGALATSPDGLTWTTRTPPGAALNWSSVTYSNGVFIAVSSNSSNNNIMRSTDGINWSLSTITTTTSWRRAAYGNGTWVVVGASSAAYSTDNGVTWTMGSPPVTTWNSVAFGNDTFVAVATSGQIMSSTNGINWTSRTPSTGGLSLRSVEFGGGVFTIAANSQTAMYSSNGINWSDGYMPDSRTWIASAYGAGRLVTIASTGTATTRYAYSDCGSIAGDSSPIPSGAIGYWKFDETSGTTAADSMGFNPGTLTNGPTFAAGIKGNAVSLDGVNDFVDMGSAASLDNLPQTSACAWINGPASQPTGSYQGILNKTDSAGQNGYSLYVGDQRGGAALEFGSTTRNNGYREDADLIPPNTWTHICSTWDGTNGASALKIYVNGTEQTTGLDYDYAGSGNISDASYNLVVGGTSGSSFTGLVDEVVLYNRVLSPTEISQVMSATSTNVAPASNVDYMCTGQNWTYRTNISAVSSLTFGNGLFVAAGGYPEELATSPDGITWTYRSKPSGYGWLSDVTYGNGLFVAISYNGPGRVMTSPDGINWTGRTAAELNSWSSVTYGGGLFVAVAGDGTNRVMTSPDGITWTARSAPATRGWEDVAYGNGIFVAMTSDGDRRMTSPDGINWTEQPGTNGWGRVAFGDGLFLISRSSGIETTSDGVTLTNQTTPVGDWYGMAYDAQSDLWVAVAYQFTNRVMTSPDAVNWTARSVPVNANFNHVAIGNGTIVALAGNGTVITSSCPPAGKFQYCDGTRWNTFGNSANNLQWKRERGNITTGGDWTGGGTGCGVLANGEAWCWGYGANGTIGNGSTSDQPYPVQVQTDTGPGGWSDWVKIRAASGHTCGIRADGSLWCWGLEDYAKLGNNTDCCGTHTRPQRVHTDSGSSGWNDWVDVALANEYTCGVRSNGTAWCWGNPHYGSLGNDAAYQDYALNWNLARRPVQVDTDSSSPGWNDWVSITVGGTHSCGVRSNGTAWCWGEQDGGALGNDYIASGLGDRQLRPVQVVNSAGGPGWTDWVQISDTCGLRANGTAWCWGAATGGLAYSDSGRPVQVPNSAGGPGWTDWIYIHRNCGLRANGTAWCWGNNGVGQYGIGVTGNETLNPQQVLNDTGGAGWNDWISIAPEGFYTGNCGVRADGSGWCWGGGDRYQLGNGSTSDRYSPTRVITAP